MPTKGRRKFGYIDPDGGSVVFLSSDELADKIGKQLDSSDRTHVRDPWKIIQGFQTGTNCGPWVEKLNLVYYVFEFVNNQMKNGL